MSTHRLSWETAQAMEKVCEDFALVFATYPPLLIASPGKAWRVVLYTIV